MKFQDKQVLLFDLDGTLVDSAPDLANAVNLMLSELGMTEFSEQCIRGWVGNGAQVLVQRALSGNAVISQTLPPATVDNALAIFMQCYHDNVCVDSQLYVGVCETLTRLKDQGYCLVLVTNKPERFVAPLLEGLGLSRFFELILGGDTLAKRKPDPMPLLHVCQQLSVTPEQCVMIGDSKNDILAAKAARMDSVGLTYGYNYGEDIAEHQPELVLDCFTHLSAAFD